MKKIIIILLLMIFPVVLFAEENIMIPDMQHELTKKYDYKSAVFIGEDYDVVYRYLNHGDKIKITCEDDDNYYFILGDTVLFVKKDGIRLEPFKEYEVLTNEKAKAYSDIDLKEEFHTFNSGETIKVVDQYKDIIVINVGGNFAYMSPEDVTIKEVQEVVIEESNSEDETQNTENEESSTNTENNSSNSSDSDSQNQESNQSSSSTETSSQENNNQEQSGSQEQSQSTDNQNSQSSNENTSNSGEQNQQQDNQSQNNNQPQNDPQNDDQNGNQSTNGDGEDIELLSYTESIPLAEPSNNDNSITGYVQLNHTPVYIATLHYGDAIKILNKTNEEYEVLFNGRIANVPTEFIRGTNDKSYNDWVGYTKNKSVLYKDFKMTEKIRETELNDTVRVIDEIGDLYVLELPDDSSKAFTLKSNISNQFIQEIIEESTETPEENSEWTEPAL